MCSGYAVARRDGTLIRPLNQRRLAPRLLFGYNPGLDGFHHPSEENAMIKALKDDSVFERLGGQFKFTSLVQHRMRELMEGARPLVERQGRSDLEVAIEEVVEGKITYRFETEEMAAGHTTG